MPAYLPSQPGISQKEAVDRVEQDEKEIIERHAKKVEDAITEIKEQKVIEIEKLKQDQQKAVDRVEQDDKEMIEHQKVEGAITEINEQKVIEIEKLKEEQKEFPNKNEK